MNDKNLFKLSLELIRFDKPIGTLLLLWPTLIALFLAEKSLPNLFFSLTFCLAVFLARSMGCIINDIADRKFDLYVERTKNRPLTSGNLGLLFAWILFVGFGLVLFALSFLFNALTIKLAFIALFLMMIYPFSKRFFPIPQLFLGLAYGFSVIMVFSATTGLIVPESFVLYLFVVIWALYYDTLYALVDLNDDLKLGIHTSAVYFKEKVFFALKIMQAFMISLLIYLGFIFELNSLYYFALILVISTLYYQHRLINKKTRHDFFSAFKNNNFLGIALLIAVLIGIQ